MQTVTIRFTANGQVLKGEGCPIKIASNTVEYVKAVFALGENWTGFDVVRAAWYTDFECISTVLDGNGECFVPWEVLSRPEGVTINLYGCDLEEESDGEAVLVDRLTTYPVKAILVDVDAMVCGSETKPVTPSQFEQYIAIVQELVGTVRDITSCVLNPDYTLTINYSDDTSDTVGPIRGEQGEQGPTGPAGNGISKIEKISTAGLVDTYRITFTNGTHKDYTVTNGAKGDTGNGIESIYLTGTSGAVKTYTILFTDGTTTEFQVTDGEVTNAVLEQVLPTDTASGAIASFPDGTNLFPLKKCEVTLEPIQDLSHGDPSPSNICPISGRSSVGVTGCGKNICDNSVFGTWSNVVEQSDGSYYASNNNYLYNKVAWRNESNYVGQLRVVYHVKYASTGTGSYPIVVYTDGTTSNIYPSETTNWQDKTFTTTSGKVVSYIRFSYASSSISTYFNLMVTNDLTATDYEPYNGHTHTIPLGQTVYGGDVEVVEGKLFEGGNEWAEYEFNGSENWDINAGQTYLFLTELAASNGNNDTTQMANWLVGGGNAYNQYGKFRVQTNGALCVGMVGNDGTNWSDVATFKTWLSNHHLQICYKKGTATPVSITPTQIQTLKGQNNIFSDSGDIDVTYKADTQLWVVKMLGQ